MTNTDAQLWAAARQLVKDMNPYEARHFDHYVEYWPVWAKRDVELAYVALRQASKRSPIEPSNESCCK